MIKPKVLVFAGYGLNCEEETRYAFELAGARVDTVHINDLISNKRLLEKYQIFAVPGGFAYGDDTGSGNAYGAKIKNHLWEVVQNFLNRDKLAIGICNGFQILARLGIFGQIALTYNDNKRYTDVWVNIKMEGSSPWVKGIKNLQVPIAHGEGKFVGKSKTVAARYVGLNPNGSVNDVAAITDKTGRIFGIMPHPERAMFFTHLPDWPLQKEKLIRANLPLPKYADGLKIFQNAVEYFK